MEIPILQDIVIIFGMSMLVLFLCDKIRVPSIIGFIVTGALIGPHGLHMIQSHHEVEVLAEIGVVLLMFMIGLELSLKDLMQNKKAVLLGGSLQVFLSIGAVLLISSFLDISFKEAVFFGFLVSLSSTAIVLGILQANDSVHTPYGKVILAILIFQDIVVVFMILLTPMLSGDTVDVAQSLMFLLLKTVIIIVLVVLCSKYVIPFVFYNIAKNKSHDFFLLSVVTICFFIAWSSSQAGLSLGLGAFLAGLIISESEYSLRALGSVFPFRSIFLSFFFISVGTLLNVSFVLENFVSIILLAALVIALKSVVLFLVCGALWVQLRAAFVVSLSLSQIGEFSFMLSKIGVSQGLMSDNAYQYFLSVTVLTMMLTPLMVFLAPRLATRLMKLPLPSYLKAGVGQHLTTDPELDEQSLEDHLVVIGLGVNGMMLVKTAKNTDIPYIIIDLNADTVRAERSKGEPILYGDATQDEVLKHARVHHAKVIVIAISDLMATRQIVPMLHKMNPKASIVVRTRFVLEVEYLLKLGASEVVPVEFEAALRIQEHVLSSFLISPNEADRLDEKVRKDGFRNYIAETMTEHYDPKQLEQIFDDVEKEKT